MASLRSLDAPVVEADSTEDATVGDLVAAAGNQEDDILGRMEKESLCRTLWGCGQSAGDSGGSDPQQVSGKAYAA